MQGRARLTALDGLRGWAALAVVFNHLLQISPDIWAAFTGAPASRGADLLTWTPLHLLWAGGEAVALFFVLSGYVLALPFWSGAGGGYAGFMVRRIFRLYPAFVVCCVGQWLLAGWIDWRPLPGVSVWFARYWRGAGEPATLIPAMLMAFGHHLNLNTALWTLIVEMRVSLIFPAIVALMKRAGAWLAPAAIMFSAACKMASLHLQDHPAAWLWAMTGAQVWLFVLGAELARRGPLLMAAARRLSPLGGGLLLGLGLLLLIAKWISPLPQAANYLLSGLGALILIFCAVGVPAVARGLNGRVSQFLGRISYSLYLFHFPIIAALVHGLPEGAPLWLVGALAVPLAMGLAALSTRWIEAPCIDMGRHLARALTAKAATARS